MTEHKTDVYNVSDRIWIYEAMVLSTAVIGVTLGRMSCCARVRRRPPVYESGKTRLPPLSHLLTGLPRVSRQPATRLEHLRLSCSCRFSCLTSGYLPRGAESSFRLLLQSGAAQIEFGAG